MTEPRRPLYLMIKPPAEIAALIGAAPAASRSRPPGLLHMTLLPLGDQAGIGGQALALLLDAIGAIDAPAFRVVFDSLHASGRTVSLRPSERLMGAEAFQRGLVAALAGHGIRCVPAYRFHPHVTLAYRGTAPGQRPIDAISWRVEEFLLIESVHGETRHIELGRWPLRAG